MSTLFYSYSIAAGWNVALANLVNVQNLFGRAVWVPNRGNPVDTFPNRLVTLSGREVSEGRVNHEWKFIILPIAKLTLFEDTYLSSATVVSAQVTIYTRLHARGTYARYNAWVALPQPGEDYEYDRGYVRNLRIRFNNMIAL